MTGGFGSLNAQWPGSEMLTNDARLQTEAIQNPVHTKIRTRSPYRPLHPPTGPAAMILPSVILGPLGLLALGGGQEAMRSSVLLGSLYCAEGPLIFAFLALCLVLTSALSGYATAMARASPAHGSRRGALG